MTGPFIRSRKTRKIIPLGVQNQKYYRHKLKENVSDSKARWKVLNDFMGKQSAFAHVNEIQTSTNNTLNDAKDIANHFNCHFTQIGPSLASNIPTSSINAEDYLKRESSLFKFTEIKPSRVSKILLKLDVTKANRLDQINNKVFKVAALVIHSQLTDLFNLSLKSREFPVD